MAIKFKKGIDTFIKNSEEEEKQKIASMRARIKTEYLGYVKSLMDVAQTMVDFKDTYLYCVSKGVKLNLDFGKISKGALLLDNDKFKEQIPLDDAEDVVCSVISYHEKGCNNTIHIVVTEKENTLVFMSEGEPTYAPSFHINPIEKTAQISSYKDKETNEITYIAPINYRKPNDGRMWHTVVDYKEVEGNISNFVDTIITLNTQLTNNLKELGVN